MTTITVVGATGQVGAKVVELLTDRGHKVVSASRSSGVDVLTGVGVDEALAGADVVVDVLNSPSFEDGPVLEFFSTSTTTLVNAAKEAGVGHYVALSIVGADGLPESGYMRAKVVQEQMIADSGLPYTIVRATQFHEFAEMITGSLIVGDEVHAPDAQIQPIAAADVAAEVATAAEAAPVDGVVNIGGPDKLAFAELARMVLASQGKEMAIVVDPQATYFGAPVNDTSLVTGDDGILATTRFADWVAAK